MAATNYKLTTLAGVPIPSPAMGRASAALGRRVRAAIESLARLPRPGIGPNRTFAPRVRRCHLEMDLPARSDRQLRRSMLEASARIREQAKGGRNGNIPESWAAEVFALVDEAIRRRLGVWRLFDDPPLHLDTAEDSTELDADERAIAAAVKLVRSVGAGRFGADCPLPARFYRAVLNQDPAGFFRFNPTDEQLLAGWRLFQGNVVEMPAGEGKTVAIAFAAALHAAAGRSVHVLTANDYLAERDCRLLAPVYRALGFSVAAILEPLDRAERHAAYQCDIVYGTLREFGFDFLRDNLAHALAEQVQPALDVAIVDEADQALIDEAATPLIIAGEPTTRFLPLESVNRAVADLVAAQGELAREYIAQLQAESPDSRRFGVLLCQGLLAQPGNPELRQLAREHPRSYRRGMAVVYPDQPDYPDDAWTENHYYLVDPQEGFVTLTARGIAWLEQRLGDFCGAGPAAVDTGKPAALSRRDARRLSLANLIYQALRAHLLLERGLDYLVDDGTVVLLDRHTGRARPDAAYQDGLQSALAAKEGIALPPDCESLAQLSAQGFAARYQFRSGITGTAMPAAEEFQQRYSLKTVVVPTTHPRRRADLPARIYATESDKLAAALDEVARCHRLGRPALVGVRSVEQSLAVSRRLGELGIDHRVLNAVNSREEAEIVRNAGALGAVTVATNMAGRGTDIILDPTLEEQLIARCLRLIAEHLTAGHPAVSVRCNSAEEAALLQSALLRRRDWSVQRCENSRTAETVEVKVSPAITQCRPLSTEDATATLDFGLGLHVISIEFNQFPRVALQLKGRSGRQGSFGSSRFLLSQEDSRLFPVGMTMPKFHNCRQQDEGGRVFYQGRPVERFLRRRESIAEMEAAHRRSLLNDYAAVADANDLEYYRRRQQYLAAGDVAVVAAEVVAMAELAASQLVNDHFPGLDADDYPIRFAQLSKRAGQLYGLNVSPWRGAPLDQLSGLLSAGLVERVESLKSRVSPQGFTRFSRQLFLECHDEAWRERRLALRRAVFASAAGGNGHKSAVADYIIQAGELGEQYQVLAAELFLSRLLAAPVDLLIGERSRPLAVNEANEESEIDRELALLIA